MATVLSSTLLSAQNRVEPGSRPDADVRYRELREIDRLYRAGQHAAVIQQAEQFVATHGRTLDSVPMLSYLAESQYRLGRVDVAIATYGDATSADSRNPQRRAAPVRGTPTCWPSSVVT